MAYSKQTFTLEQVLSSAEMNQIEDNISDHDHSNAGTAKVKISVSSDDSTPGYLEDKLAAGTGTILNVLSAGGNEQIEITAGMPSGTVLAGFVQTAAPTGWTKSTTHNDKSLRIVSGTISTGGTDAFSVAFSPSKASEATTISEATMAAHTHTDTLWSTGGGSEGTSVVPSNDTTLNTESGSTGGGGSHTHDITMDVKYVDVIIAIKD